MKGKECSVPQSIFFFWWEDLALSFNDRLTRWKVTWKPNEQRAFRLPLLGSQGGNEKAEKKLSVRREADRSDRQAFQKQPGGEQTSSCSQWKAAGQPAPELLLLPSAAKPPLCSHPAGSPSWHHRAISPGVGQLGWGQDGSLHSSLPTCQSCPPHPSSLAQGFSGCWTADLGKGMSRKIQNLGSYPGLGGIFFTHFPGSATGQCSHEKCHLCLPDLLWSEGILLDRGMGYHSVGLSTAALDWRVTPWRFCNGWKTNLFWLLTVPYRKWRNNTWPIGKCHASYRFYH